MALTMPMYRVSDCTYRKHEDLLLRSATRLKGLPVYRLFTIPLLLTAGWLSHSAAAQAELLWAILLLLVTFNLLNLYSGLRASDGIFANHSCLKRFGYQAEGYVEGDLRRRGEAKDIDAQRRPFDLAETLKEVLLTRRPLFKHVPLPKVES